MRVTKGINKGLRFKGVVGQYVILMAAELVVGLLAMFFCNVLFGSFLILILITVALIMALITTRKLSTKFGENGLTIYLAYRYFKPRIIRNKYKSVGAILREIRINEGH